MDTINRDLKRRIPTPAEDTAFFNKKEAEAKAAMDTINRDLKRRIPTPAEDTAFFQ